ncbi:MAG TPA: MATE family efflux transporter [Rhabdochlamydiaceae bacterium]|nr:MATE family efflux transporter [Rhabdochlamydiaceae bacterium]
MGNVLDQPDNRLTPYPASSLRELLYLSSPLILSFFSASFMGFCSRLFLSHYSLDALQGCTCAIYLCTLFQHPCMKLAASAQVFVGLFKGSNTLDRIGEYIWQMIWFSFLSMILTIPLGLCFVPSFFEGSAIKQSGLSYFNVLLFANFLFPLGTALSCFYIGQGKTKIIFFTTFITHTINILLDLILIFGIKGVISPLGATGAAISTALSQAFFCFVLLILFLRKKERQAFGSGNYRFKWGSFWECTRTGFPRALARVFTLTAWAAIVHIMTFKGGDYLIVLSIGGTLMLLFSFINDGMLQGMITIASTLIGAKNYAGIWKMVRSSFLFLVITTLVLSIPYLLYPEVTLSFFSLEPINDSTLQLLKRSFLWLWIFFFCYGFCAIGLSLITASQDIYFYLSIIGFVWLTSYVPAHFSMNVWHWPADSIWLIMAFDSLIFGTIFLWRASKESWKVYNRI